MSNIGYRLAVAVLVAGVVGGFGSGIAGCGRHHKENARGEACETAWRDKKGGLKNDATPKTDAPKADAPTPAPAPETPPAAEPAAPVPPQQ